MPPAARPSALAPTLPIAPTNDSLEGEADRAAEQALRTPDLHPQPTTAPTRIARKCQGCADEDEGKRVQPKAGGQTSTPPAGEAPPSVHEALRGSGQPLEEASQTFFAPRFGHDFSHIRIHTDTQAAQSARDVKALAYTAGHHIVFAPGQYAPTTSTGKALLAHELAHTVQQAPQRGAAPLLSRRVVTDNCPANQDSAPAAPRTDLEAADRFAVDYATKAAQALAADAQAVRGGIPDPPSASLKAFQRRFGMPAAPGTGYLNRLTGDVRPSREIALSEELSIISTRYARVATLINQGLSYTCPGKRSVSIAGCDPGPCGTEVASSCPGNSLVVLCERFWREFDNGGRGVVIIHETFHIAFGRMPDRVGSIRDATTRGPGRNFNIAGCYHGLVSDLYKPGIEEKCPAPP